MNAQSGGKADSGEVSPSTSSCILQRSLDVVPRAGCTGLSGLAFQKEAKIFINDEACKQQVSRASADSSLWEPLDPWLFLDRLELASISATCCRNSQSVAKCTPFGIFSSFVGCNELNEDEQSPQDSDGTMSEDDVRENTYTEVDESPIPDAGWPNLSEDQQLAFEQDLSFWLHGTSGSKMERLRRASWRFAQVSHIE